MSEKESSEQSPQPEQVAASPISSMFGPTRLLPGESAEVYRAGLIATIKDLGATTHLQIYLAEKIFQCLWWMCRYEIQKQAAVVNAMVNLLTDAEHRKINFTQLPTTSRRIFGMSRKCKS